jgi:EAL domain-containing protein (putative c-di-GMP-specific phosphodiesterase class I)
MARHAAGLREWGTFAAHHAPFTLSLNVSAYSLADLTLPDKLLALTGASGVSPARIVLEITESGLVREQAKALHTLTRLWMKPFQLSIDNFGTGDAMMQ